MTENENFVKKRIGSILTAVGDLEKKDDIPSWDVAKVIWDDFLEIHEYALKNLSNKRIPVVTYSEDAKHYRSDEMLQIVKTTCTKILDGVEENDSYQETHGIKPIIKIENLFSKFHLVAKQLKQRHANRKTLEISDEYDVQDLLHALLKIDFDDVRTEEWTPSYAGSSSRMDFLLKQEKIVVETKKTRDGLGAKEVGEQLIVDITKYQKHSDCETLLCFVYDSEERIQNPDGIERDLSQEVDGFEVKVFIRPKGL